MRIRIAIDGKPAVMVGTAEAISESIERIRRQGHTVERIPQPPRDAGNDVAGYRTHSAFLRR